MASSISVAHIGFVETASIVQHEMPSDLAAALQLPAGSGSAAPCRKYSCAHRG